MPFDRRIPGLLAALSADDAEIRLRKGFDRQFGHADGEIRAAAQALGLFGEKYLQGDRRLSDDERAHYIQLVKAVTDWGARAGLGDTRRGHAAIPKLVLGARGSGLRAEADFRRRGMDESLQRLQPMTAALKDVLRGYGLDLDASLDGMVLTEEGRDGDHARVRMRYTLGGATIDTSIAVFARLARSRVVSVRVTDFVEAAYGSGGTFFGVLWRHILPNSLTPVIALAALQFGSAILQISTLGFLGYGAPPPTPEWGLLIAEGRNYVATAWWLTVLPGVVVVLVVLATNRLSQALRGGDVA